MRWIFYILLLISSNTWASDFIKGDGSFIAKDGDSYEFIKEQLYHEGVKSIVSKELTRLGLNKEVFWQKYDEKINEKFTDIKTNLKEIHKIDQDSTPNRIKSFENKLRVRKLKYRKSFANMDKLLSKFAITKISRSQKNPRYRYIKLEGQINSNLLTSTYYNLVRGKKTSDYGSLFLNTTFNLNGISYSEIGIDNENDFEGEVSKNWLDWFSKNKPGNIANTEILDPEKLEKLESYLKLPTESMLLNIPDIFVNSLLLDVEIVITKKKFNKKLKEYFFEYEGHAYLKDLQTNLVIGSYKFSKTEKSYRVSNKISIANIIANHVYHMAKGSFPQIERNIKDITPISSIKKLTLTNFENVKQINTFLNLLQSRGVKFSLKAKLDSISRTKASVIMYFDGEYNEVKSLFSTLQSAKKDLSFELIDTDNTLGIKFNRVIEKL